MSSAYDDFFAYSRYERLIVRLGRLAERWRARFCAVLAACIVLFAIYAIVLHQSGGITVDQSVIVNSAYYKESLHNSSLYTWLADVRDDNVSSSVISARKALARADLLPLVASTTNDSTMAPTMKCGDLLSVDAAVARFYNDLLYDTAEFLTNTSTCACAPMFGKSVRYMAFAGSKQAAKLEHAINPVDTHADEYDALDANFFAENRIDLVIEQENDDYRYNEPRGHFAVIRRSKLAIALLDKECRKQKLKVTSHLALCAQRCFDMMRGIDVRERARMQYVRGVTLNKATFEALVQPSTEHSARKDEL